MTKNATDKVVIHPRISAQLRDELHEFAQRTHRSMNGAVEYLLEQGVRAESPTTDDHTHLRTAR